MAFDALTKPGLTGEDVLLNAPSRGELIEGEWVAMNPAGLEHGWIESNIALELHLWNRTQRLGRVFVGEVGFYTRGNERTVRAPDVAFISYQRLPMEASLQGFATIAPDLVVEIMSPGDTASEIEAKTQEWLAFGVRLVWVVYPKTQRVHVFQPDQPPLIVAADGLLEGDAVLPDLRIVVQTVFRG